MPGTMLVIHLVITLGTVQVMLSIKRSIHQSVRELGYKQAFVHTMVNIIIPGISRHQYKVVVHPLTILMEAILHLLFHMRD